MTQLPPILKHTKQNKMRKCITIGGKIGYLNPKNGRYMWANIVGIDGEFMTIKTEVKITRGKTIPNVYKEAIKDVINWLKTPSPDFKDGRTLLKYKGTTSLTF